jgi:CRISPR type III-A-associated RAMP protein Csm4
MNPGLIVKLRPTGPWRIGPDSGARNRVDAIYHSDSLYSAVAQAMSRLGALEEWLDATARAATPAVCFSSCFPLVNETLFVTPPRTVWPPGAASLTSGRVRWKSARFVPLNIVHDILSAKALDENRWMLDGPSGCLMPSGKPGPFRASVRWNAAIDRLSGAAERHSAACMEFRPGAGLWTVVSFANDATRNQWQDRVKAAFRWLADSGFGGERSRGWGRSEAPEFVEGTLPEMILGAAMGAGGRESGVGNEQAQGPDVLPPMQEPPQEEPPIIEPPAENPDVNPPEPSPDPELPPPDPEPALASSNHERPSLPQLQVASPNPQPLTFDPQIADSRPLTPDPQPADSRPLTPQFSVPSPSPRNSAPQWLLSLFSPAAADAVEWSRGNYSLIERGGRVESSAGSGALKKQVQMVAEGSVLYAGSALCGAAPDVAPEGFAHPVFRAGFALAIPLPEVS